MFRVTLKFVAAAEREVMSNTRPEAPVICPVSRKLPAVPLLDVKVAGARFAVIIPERVTAASARIPTRSVPSAVLKMMGLVNVAAFAK